MNPYKRFKNWVIGDALAATDDIFEKGKIELLFNFTCLFLLLNPGFFAAAIHAPLFQRMLALSGIFLLAMVLVTLKTTSNVTWASIAYIIGHSIQNFGFFFAGNGIMSNMMVPFLILYISFGFLLLRRKWGIVLSIITVAVLVIGIYNVDSGFKLFYFESGKDLQEPPKVMILLPLLLNVYLVSGFFGVRIRAEKQIADQKAELEKNHKELAERNRDTIASINYASRIQQAMLPTEETILRSIPLSFLLYQPRDIVCGDFYWFHEIDRDNYIIVCADCTGHGVPGALMTMIGNSVLNQVIADGKTTSPSAILNEMDKRIAETLKQQKQHDGLVQDSMDLALIKVDKQSKKFIFCGAKRPIVFIHFNELAEFKGSKYTLGGLSEEKKFEEIEQAYTEGDVVYLFTDGFADQFGGEGKKFLIKNFRELLYKVHTLPMHEQKAKLETTLNDWKQSQEQTDDILVIGIKF